MQFSKAAELRKRWRGGTCEHKRLEKEYMASMQTGDYICTRCGAVFTPEEARALTQRNTERRGCSPE